MEKFNIVKQTKIINVVINGYMTIMGLFLLISTLLPLPFEFPVKLEVILICVVCLLAGAAKILGYFSNDLYRLAFQFDFAMGLFLIIIGIVTLAVGQKDPLGTARIFGIFVLLDGLVKFQTAFDAKKFGVHHWLIIMITAVLVVGVGVTTLIAPYFENMSQFILLYVSMIVDGMVNIWITAYAVRVRAKKKNFAERFGVSEDMFEDPKKSS